MTRTNAVSCSTLFTAWLTSPGKYASTNVLISAPSISKTLKPRESHAMRVTTRDFGPGPGLVMVGGVGGGGGVMLVVERRPNELRLRCWRRARESKGPAGPPAAQRRGRRSSDMKIRMARAREART